MLRNSALSTAKKVAEGFGLSVKRYSTDRAWLGLNHRGIKTVIDVGANRGQFMELALGAIDAERYVCIEPLPQAQDALREVASRFPRVAFEYHQVVAGEHEDRAQFNVHATDTSSSLLHETREGTAMYPTAVTASTIDVAVAPLDQLITIGDSMGRVLLKVDTQGYEDRVLRGATTLLAHVDACILEYAGAPLYQGQAAFADLVQLTAAAGLRFAGCLEQHYTHDGSLSFTDAVFVR